MVKNGTPASPAMARASSVLPVPGEPTSSAPLGILPPRRAKRDGSFRKSTISCKLLARLVDAGDVVEGDAALLLGQQLGARLAEAHRARARILLHLAHHEEGDAEDQQEGQRLIEQQQPHRGRLFRLGAEADAVILESLHELRIARRDGVEGLIVADLAGDHVVGDHDVLDAAVIDLREEVRIGDRVARAVVAHAAVEQRDKQEQGADDGEHDQHVLHPGVAVALGFLVVVLHGCSDPSFPTIM